MKIRPKIEAALASTAERLAAGSGSDAVHHAKNDLATIGATSENLDKRYADQEVTVAAPVIFETKHPDGDHVAVDGKHDGIIVVYPDSFIFVRAMGFGAREVKAVETASVDVEMITTVLDGAEVPGLRITGRSGKPKFAVAIAQAKTPGDPAEQAAIRDEIYRSLGG